MDSTRLAAARRRAFGQQLRALRMAAGMSQAQLAAASGLHRTYVGSVERGERNLSMDAMWQLADSLGLSPRDLFPPATRQP